MKSTLIFGREPSVILGLVAVVVQFFSAFVMEVKPDTQTAVNAVAATAVGLLVAWKVGDGVLAALTGLAQAGLALGMNLGLDWSTAKQAAYMALITIVAQAFVRTQVSAPVPATAVKRAVRSVS
ncbi:hypothetical protein ACH4TX_41930 [Streptomyces sp. NPDC021098]|uniref:hypothetical protein n=1 Tax=unclassified Streptomyces TaxID=2593676 RepID=UPI0037B91B46